MSSQHDSLYQYAVSRTWYVCCHSQALSHQRELNSISAWNAATNV